MSVSAARWRLPHPLVLLLAGVAVAAVMTWVLPAGEFDRRDDPSTGRRIVVAGTYHSVASAPVSAWAAMVAVPRGFVDAAEVVAVVLFVGGAWVVVDRLGTLTRLVEALVSRFRRRRLLAIPIVSAFFLGMGALENMQEEIIPLVPVLLLLGRRLGVDPITVVAMSAGAAMVGSAFGPTNPFQAGIAMHLAGLSPDSHLVMKIGMLGAASVLWIWWTVRHATRVREDVPDESIAGLHAPTSKDLAIFLAMLAPMAAYVYGAARLDWGFNQLSAGFLIGGIAAGLIGRLGLEGTVSAFIDGMQTLLPAAMMVGAARAISVVLEDGHVIDTMLSALSGPLAAGAPAVAVFLMIPFHVLIHVVVPSVSGHAVLTMPLLVPLSDLLGVSRDATVIAYQLGAGLTDALTPTNGALMAVLVAAGVSWPRWLRFAFGGMALVALVGVAAILRLLA